MMKIDLRKCKRGDTLISTHGYELEYISPTPWENITYSDHVVRYVKDKDGKSYPDNCYGTRTHDGYTYPNKMQPETDHDIAEIIHNSDFE